MVTEDLSRCLAGACINYQESSKNVSLLTTFAERFSLNYPWEKLPTVQFKQTSDWEQLQNVHSPFCSWPKLSDKQTPVTTTTCNHGSPVRVRKYSGTCTQNSSCGQKYSSTVCTLLNTCWEQLCTKFIPLKKSFYWHHFKETRLASPGCVHCNSNYEDKNMETNPSTPKCSPRQRVHPQVLETQLSFLLLLTPGAQERRAVHLQMNLHCL